MVFIISERWRVIVAWDSLLHPKVGGLRFVLGKVVFVLSPGFEWDQMMRTGVHESADLITFTESNISRFGKSSK